MRRHLGQVAIASLSVLLLAACQPEPTPEAGVRLVEGSRSTPAFPGADLTIEAPEPGAVVQDSALRARIGLTGFELGSPTEGADRRGLAMSGNGQHVHFIVDDRPYRALYDLSDSIPVAGLEPGLHLLRAFASRQWHESVKGERAFDVVHFWVRDTTRDGSFDRDAPLLTYSRPKGTYSGSAADSVMVDFHLRNATLGPDAHSVRLTVDDSITHTIESWAPHYLLGLGDGDHAIRLELIAPDGSVVPGRFNTAERMITVERGSGGG